ncbi:unnamed protein product [Meganyctiphanes norvegica]|uniref:tRNA N(3)-methylcytidine methyltransferase n=1 Tax=Meganyctiphanes norvegica TaxID=48144 RepID=A0AAV2SQU7_MEGNR
MKCFSTMRGVSTSTLLRLFSCKESQILNLLSWSQKLRLYSSQKKKTQRPPGIGGRFLKDWTQVFSQNNWDNVEWDAAQEEAAQAKVTINSEVTLTQEDIDKLEEEAANKWDVFYGIHQNRFFKDRHWLFTEFPELAPHLAHTFTVKLNKDGTPQNEENSEIKVGEEISMDDVNATKPTEIINAEGSKNQNESEKEDITATDKLNELTESQNNEDYPGYSSKFRILEIGCGVGNTVFPILETNNDPGLFVYCCDFSSTAIDIVKETKDYNAKRCRAFVCDITLSEWAEAPFPENSLDIIICIFVLSALDPAKLQSTVNKLASYLRPGGMILFRDYGRYDLAQLRFKKGRCLGEHFYARGDGTRCYFFTQDDVDKLMTGAGLEKVQNLVDRRLQVNRGKQLTMYRVWVQAKYRKPAV